MPHTLRIGPGSESETYPLVNQAESAVVGQFRCPPNRGCFGGLEVLQYQFVMPAGPTPRLTTCVR